MAQLLVKNRPRASNWAGDYDLNDIVMVAEDPHVFSAREQDPARFRIVSVPGTRDAVKHYLSPEPPAMRDMFPASFLASRKYHHVLARITRNEGSIRKQRRYFVGPGDAVQIKPVEP